MPKDSDNPAIPAKLGTLFNCPFPSWLFIDKERKASLDKNVAH